MSEQYFAREPTCASSPAECAVTFQGHTLRFETDAGVFSRGAMDRGTELLLNSLPPLQGEVLDLGCGWGALGICLKAVNPSLKMTLVDVNRRALELARKNASVNTVGVDVLESDGFAVLGGRRFDAVVTNPPIRAGKKVIYRLFADASEHLAEGGGLYLVIRKQQGAESCEKTLRTLFGRVQTLKKSGGFWTLGAFAPLAGAASPK